MDSGWGATTAGSAGGREMWEPGTLAAFWNTQSREGTAVPTYLEVLSKMPPAAFPEPGVLLLGAMKWAPQRDRANRTCARVCVCVCKHVHMFACVCTDREVGLVELTCETMEAGRLQVCRTG